MQWGVLNYNYGDTDNFRKFAFKKLMAFIYIIISEPISEWTASISWSRKRSLGFYASSLNRHEIFIGEGQILSSDTIVSASRLLSSYFSLNLVAES